MALLQSWVHRIAFASAFLVCTISTSWAENAVAPAGARAKRTKVQTEDPGAILRKRAAGADTLIVNAGTRIHPKPGTLLKVEDPATIAALLHRIDTPRVPTNGSTGHGCAGGPPIQFFKGRRLLARISFDHTSVLVPDSNGLWKTGAAFPTEESRRAVARWFADQGLPHFQDEIDANDKEQQRWDAFHQAFPPQSRGLLEKPEKRRIALTTMGGKADPAPVPCPANQIEPLASEVPDPIQRARTIFQALGLLDEPMWHSYRDEDVLVLRWAECLGIERIAQTIQAVADRPVELRGAAHVLFGAPTHLYERLSPELAERLALQVLPSVLAHGDSDNVRWLPFLLDRYSSRAATQRLVEIAGSLELTNDRCSLRRQPIAPVGALFVLALRSAVPAALLEKAQARSWSCPENQHTLAVAAAVAARQLPAPEDVEALKGEGKLLLWEHLKRQTSPEAEDLVRESFLPALWGSEKADVQRWLDAREAQRSKTGKTDARP